MGATFMDEDGKEKPLIMGCYGVGVSRSLAAVVEQHNDEHGIVWPVSVAPYEVAVIPLDPKKEECATVCEQIVDFPIRRMIAFFYIIQIGRRK